MSFRQVLFSRWIRKWGFFRRRQLKFVCLVLLIVISIYSIICYFLQPSSFSRPTEYSQEIFLSSSYYYTKSKSLGRNAFAVVLAGSRNYFDNVQSITFYATNETDNVYVTAPIEVITPLTPCPWIDVFVQTNLLENMSSVHVFLGNRMQQIPFSLPRTKKHDVVTCISPLFANEQWQYLVLAAHTYKKYGSHMHLYVRSMVEPVFQLMRQYESQGYLTLQPWIRLKLSSVDTSVMNPNKFVGFRNQEAAQTDCLLQHKETAKFIAFMDLDDILIPRSGASYVEEFELMYNMKPNIAYLLYKKLNVHVEAQLESSKFSLSRTISSIKYTGKSETSKSVVRPDIVNCSWIHWPPSLPEELIWYDVPEDKNTITHLKHGNQVSVADLDRSIDPSIYPVAEEGEQTPLLSRSDIQQLQLDLERMKASPKVRRIWSKLPTEWYYFNIIYDCYYNKYHKFLYANRGDKMTCTGPDSCEFPHRISKLCVNAAAEYYSSKPSKRFSLHFWKNSRFVTDQGCIQ